MTSEVYAIVQARMGSTRLPGKVLKPIMGKPMLWYLLTRLKNTPELTGIIVATSTNSNDDPISDFCTKEGFPIFRGSEDDVLDRFYRAATKYKADHLVRITADCPLIDPTVVGAVIKTYFEKKYDYYSVATGAAVAFEGFTGRYPDGLDAEVFPYGLLKTAWEEAKDPLYREHVTPFMWKQPERFNIAKHISKIDYSNMRWTVDNEGDFELISWIFETLYSKNPMFDMTEIIKLLSENPEKLKLNQHFIGNEKYGELWKN